MRTKIPPLMFKHLYSLIRFFRLKFFILTGLLLILNCQHDDVINGTSTQEQHSKTVIPFEYNNKTYSELSNELKFSDAFNKVFKKDKLNPSENGKTVMEEQYGFTIDSALIKEISSDNYTSYTFLIHREIADDSFFENLVVTLDSSSVPSAYIIKYNLNSDPIYINVDYAYSLDATTELTQIDYNDSEAKYMYFGTDGCTIITLMCPYLEDHPAGAGCIAQERGDLYYDYDSSGCSSDPDGGGVGDGTPPSSGSPSGGTTGGNGNPIITEPNVPCQGRDCPEEIGDVYEDCETTLENMNNFYSSNSPFNVDLGELIPCENIDTDSVAENQKFMCVYNKLTQSPKFKNLFIDTFGESENINVRFVLTDTLANSIGGVTVQDPENQSTIDSNGNLNLNLLISMNKNHLISNHLAAESTIEIARNILHECIHAFLYVKKYNCNNGSSIDELNNLLFGELINEYYDGSCSPTHEQHEFIFDYLIPTLSEILSDVKDGLIPSSNQDYVSDLDFLNSSFPNNPLIASHLFNWEEYYEYISLVGLTNTEAFQQEIGSNNINDFLFRNYVYTSNQFSKNYCNE
jgi:hypothetical protein